MEKNKPTQGFYASIFQLSKRAFCFFKTSTTINLINTVNKTSVSVFLRNNEISRNEEKEKNIWKFFTRKQWIVFVDA